MPQVLPYSGAMLAMVARSASGRFARPSPKNSTNLSTTPFLRSISVTVSTRSVAVAPGCRRPSRRKPITCGISMVTAWPSMAASDRKSTRLNSSHEWISYAVFCLKKKKKQVDARLAHGAVRLLVGDPGGRPVGWRHDVGVGDHPAARADELNGAWYTEVWGTKDDR